MAYGFLPHAKTICRSRNTSSPRPFPATTLPKKARILERFGKTAAATLIREKLPDAKSIRSGDLGEILATEYISEHTS